jgi:hypothetical protein
MWTVKQNNRVATFMEVVYVVVGAAAGIVAAVLGHWLAVLAAAAVVAWVAAGMVLGRRTRGEPKLLLFGRARDERQAHLQLRAYATVGQASMVVFIVGFGVELARLSFGVWTILLAFAGVVGIVSIVILRELEK